MLKLTVGALALSSTLALACSAYSSRSVLAQDSQSAIYQAPPEVIARIREEGLKRSQVMATIGTLTDTIGPRLTASPSMKRANEWTRDAMARWGMQNAHLEPFGPFGRGWTLQRFECSLAAPYKTPLIAYPKAWSPSTKGPVTAEVVFLDARKEADLSMYKGKLKGKVVLVSEPRELKAEFEAQGTRLTDDELSKLANDPIPTPAPTPTAAPASTSSAPRGRGRSQGQPRVPFGTQRLLFLKQEGALAIIDNSTKGSGGTVFVAGASVPQDEPLKVPDYRGRTTLQPYHIAAQAKMLPQMTMATEDYNRLVRMLGRGQKASLTVNIQAQYQDSDLMGYNTVAEIPGTDLKDEVVMMGGHLDSWHAGTGATDNAAGAGVAMEAARIIQALGLKPRRTIRVALWSGEEQGLHGSNAYVKQHFANLPEPTPPAPGAAPASPNPDAPKPVLTKLADYEKFSAYFNMDNGTGKFRGVYAQGNSAVMPIFGAWLKPFADLGATTMTMRNTGSTDHISFDRVGLPGFQFIQDKIEYFPRTHHSNQDVLDRIQADDVKQAATIMAAFVYQTAMMDEKMPRKPMQ